MKRDELDQRVLTLIMTPILPVFDSGAMAACLLAELETISGVSEETFSVLICIAAQLAKHSADCIVADLKAARPLNRMTNKGNQ